MFLEYGCSNNHHHGVYYSSYGFEIRHTGQWAELHHSIAELSRVKDGMKRLACEVLDHDYDLQECLKNNSYIVVELKDENDKDS